MSRKSSSASPVPGQFRGGPRGRSGAARRSLFSPSPSVKSAVTPSPSTLQRDRGGQAEAQPRPVKAGARHRQCGFGGRRGHSRRQDGIRVETATYPNHTDSSDQFIRHGARAAHGHVVLHLAHALGVQEAGDEDVGVRPIELLAAEWVARSGRSGSGHPWRRPGSRRRRSGNRSEVSKASRWSRPCRPALPYADCR